MLLFRKKACKGTAFFLYTQIFAQFFRFFLFKRKYFRIFAR